MEFRKVQKTGGSTFIVSLPKGWVKKNGIKEGDIIQLSETENGNLLLSKKFIEEKVQRSATLYVDNEGEELVLRKLIALYLAGFNTIRVESKSVLTENIKNEVMKFTTLSLGVEIVEEGNNFILLQDLSKFSDLPMEKMLQRLYNMTENMLLDVMELIRKYNEQFALDIIERDMQLDRLFWLISKQFYMALENSELLKALDIEITRAFNIRSISKLLERIGDHAVSITRLTIENKFKSDELLPLMGQTLELFRLSYVSYKHLDVDQANSVIQRAHEFSSMARKTIENIKGKRGKEIVDVAFVIESLIRIAMYSSDIAEITIDEKMMKQI